MTTIEAVRELRKQVGESQQAFATRLGLSIRAIANYETKREPTARALAQLQVVAKEFKRKDLWDIFREALNRELQADYQTDDDFDFKLPSGWERYGVALLHIIQDRFNPDRKAMTILESMKPWADRASLP
jgi:transcriptional regulator with XRE-family HTH domain